MTRRFKSTPSPKPYPVTLGQGAERQLSEGAQWLCVWRMSATMTWEGLAKRSGLSIERIAAIESRKDQASDSEMVAITQALRTTPAEIARTLAIAVTVAN